MAPNSRPRRETVAAPSHPTLLLPAVCNLWSNSSMLPYSNINKGRGRPPRPPSGLVNVIEAAAANHRGKGRRRTSGRPTPLKTSQHDMIERHVAGPHQEPRDFKPTPNDMGSSLVQVLIRTARSLSSRDSTELYLHDGQDSQERRSSGEKGRLIEGYEQQGPERGEYWY